MPLTAYPSNNNPREVKKVWIFTSGAWREVKALFTYVGGLWRKIYESTVSIDINFSGADQNLRTIYTQRTGDNSGNPVDVVFTLLAGHTLYASSVSNYGLSVGTWPAGSSVTLRVNGRIVGAGGAGGFVSGNPLRGTAGGAGGPALRINNNTSWNFALINNGTIAGGGGGGGPACAGCCTCFLCSPAFVSGGVGAGVNPATGGGSGCSSKRSCNGNTSCCSGGSGGAVGSPGGNGSNGCGCNIGTTAGGAAGAAIVNG